MSRVIASIEWQSVGGPQYHVFTAQNDEHIFCIQPDLNKGSGYIWLIVEDSGCPGKWGKTLYQGSETHIDRAMRSVEWAYEQTLYRAWRAS